MIFLIETNYYKLIVPVNGWMLPAYLVRLAIVGLDEEYHAIRDDLLKRMTEVESLVDTIPRTLEDLVNRVLNRKSIEKDMATTSQVQYTSGKPNNKNRGRQSHVVGSKHWAPGDVSL
jgi:hypothetical protein